MLAAAGGRSSIEIAAELGCNHNTVKTLEEQPRGATHWSTRSMAAATGMSQSTVSRIWRAFGLKPHQTKAFKLSPDRS